MGRLDDDDGEFGGYFDGGGGRADRDHLGESRSDTGPASRGEARRDGALKATPSRRGGTSRAKRAEAARALRDLAEGRVRLSAPVGPGQPNYPEDASKAVRVAGLFGARGVRDLQGRLNRDHLADIGPPALKEDGVFGPVTLAASERAAARRIAAARKKAETDRKRAVTSAQARTRTPTRRPDPGRPDLNLPKKGGLLGHPEPETKPEPKPAPHPNRRDPTRAMLETLKRTARTEAERQTLNVIAAELSTIERLEREDERKRRADVEAALGQRIGPDKAARAARSLFGEEDSSGLFYGAVGDDRLVSGEADDRLGAADDAGERFDGFYRRLEVREGRKFTNYSNDPGGPTKFGVTQKSLNDYHGWKDGRAVGIATDARDLDADQAATVYREFYHDKYRVGEIEDDGVAEHIFDINVNPGPKRAADWAQQELRRVVDPDHEVDGVMGSKTIKALNDLTPDQRRQVNNGIAEKREAFYRKRVKEDPNLTDNLPGWINRARSFRR